METNISSKKRKYGLIGLGILATSLLTFFGIRYWKKNKKTSETDSKSPDFKAENPYQAPTKKSQTKTNKEVIKTARPKSDTTKTNTQTNKAKTKSTKDETASKIKDFKTNVKQDVKKAITPALLAKGLQLAYLSKDFLKAFKYLQLIHTTKDYVIISKLFSLSLLGRVRKTLVTGLLEVFKSGAERKLLFTEFKRIGLKQKGTQWSLGELEGIKNLLITSQPTKVWKDPKTSVPVPINMVLGREVCKRGLFILFENQKHYYLVDSTSVKSY